MVDTVEETADEEVVYNCRVAEWHTYFVGDDGWGWCVWAHNACLVMVQVTEADAVGLGYAQAAWSYRTSRNPVNAGTPANLAYWQAGGHNIGYITTTRFTPNRVYVSGRIGHSEEQMHADPRLSDVPRTDRIISIFTERSPCPSCLEMLQEWVADQKEPDKVYCYYIIPYAAGSTDNQGSQLLTQYGELGSADW